MQAWLSWYERTRSNSLLLQVQLTSIVSGVPTFCEQKLRALCMPFSPCVVSPWLDPPRTSEQAGLDPANALNISLASLGISFVGGVIVWVLLAALGRRTIYLSGLLGIFVVQMAIGFIAIPHLSSSTAWATGVMLLVFSAVYSLSVGPVTYCIVGETPSTRLRSKTVALARNTYNIFTIINNILTNYQINATAWDWKGKAGFFWAGSCALCFCWAYFRLPETKARTSAELNMLFESGFRARDFSKTEIGIDQLSLDGSEKSYPGSENVKTAGLDV